MQLYPNLCLEVLLVHGGLVRKSCRSFRLQRVIKSMWSDCMLLRTDPCQLPQLHDCGDTLCKLNHHHHFNPFEVCRRPQTKTTAFAATRTSRTDSTCVRNFYFTFGTPPPLANSSLTEQNPRPKRLQLLQSLILHQLVLQRLACLVKLN